MQHRKLVQAALYVALAFGGSGLAGAADMDCKALPEGLRAKCEETVLKAKCATLTGAEKDKCMGKPAAAAAKKPAEKSKGPLVCRDLPDKEFARCGEHNRGKRLANACVGKEGEDLRECLAANP